MRLYVARVPRPYRRRLYRCYRGVVLRIGLREFVFQRRR